MTETPKDTGDLRDLRARAEEALEAARHQNPDEETQALENVSPAMARLLHELHVQKIELELQNEELRGTEERLSQSRDKYLDLYHGAPIGYLTLDAEGRILEANHTCGVLLDVEAMALQQRSLGLFVVPEDQNRWQSHAARALESGERQTLELQMERADGTPLYVRAVCVAATGPHGERQLRLTLSDISERVRAEAALSQSEGRYRDLVETMNEGLAVVDAGFYFSFVNQRLTEMLGYAREELLGVHVTHFVAPEYQEVMHQQIYRRKHKQAAPYRLVWRRRDGERLVTLVSPKGLFDAAGHFVGSLGVFTDITRWVQAEQERELLLDQVQAQAQQVQQILDTVPAGVLLLDAGLRLRLANPPARAALARLGGVTVGEPLDHLGPHPTSELLDRHIDPMPIEITVSQPAHQVFEVQARPVDDGATHRWVLTLRDVTEERAIQEQMRRRERLATVGQLAAGIAHDFNNVLSNIVLYASLLLQSPHLSAQEQQRLNVIREQGHHAANLVQQILDFARQSVMQRNPLSLAPFLKEIEKMLARTLPENIRLELVYGHDDYVVNVDPTRIQQAVMNLVLNARDAMPAGGELHIELARVQVATTGTAPVHGMPAGEWVRLAVSDTGSGIPPEFEARIFEPFFTTKEAGAGTGLGLAQVYGIVRQHEGFIDVQSQPGEGTTFAVYLPAWVEPAAARELNQESALPRGNGETLLVVEDNSATRDALADILDDLGYHVRTARDGQEALERFDSQVSLVISDSVMPHMSGQALLAALQAQRPDVKVIMITGYPLNHEVQETAPGGAVTRLSKPFSLEEIAHAVRQALD